MKATRSIAGMALTGAIAIHLLFSGAPAFADEVSPTTNVLVASEVVSDIAAAEPAALASNVQSDSNSAIVVVSPQGAVDIPKDAQEGVTSSFNGMDVNIGLPVGSATKDSVVVGTTAVFQDSDHTTVAVQPLADGSLRTLIAINSAEAPHDYAFPLGLPLGVTPELQDDGSVNLVRTVTTTDPETGEVANVKISVASMDAAWAKDANGNDLPSRYTLAGETLVQHVDFGVDTAFPVIADPSFSWNWKLVNIGLNKTETRYVGHGPAWAIGGAIGATIGVVGGGGAGAVIGGAAVGGLLASIGADRVDSHLSRNECLRIRAQWVGAPWDLGVFYSWGKC